MLFFSRLQEIPSFPFYVLDFCMFHFPPPEHACKSFSQLIRIHFSLFPSYLTTLSSLRPFHPLSSTFGIVLRPSLFSYDAFDIRPPRLTQLGEGIPFAPTFLNVWRFSPSA